MKYRGKKSSQLLKRQQHEHEKASAEVYFFPVVCDVSSFNIAGLAFYSTFINENCSVKKKIQRRKQNNQRDRREKEEIKNQQTTNNIILTSRAISRALKAISCLGKEKCRKEPKACCFDEQALSGSGSHKLNNI